ncbi:LpqN/LpqT family lipoprotein [Mycobacterium yunnanensis]|uniref:LpqN/LpqT family lipoprotein n=1 Tax=Mycobacterium yunnanensis TaxID=368477 RepID=A0A9X2YYY0_9MYCO|nr:LpqN/LpqT family lipoprotein [Mycobacterium yunnanensis]MCV7419387.1 LpqN/LpqT family lipoprotein [Mycobacterium yunnanensis]
MRTHSTVAGCAVALVALGLTLAGCGSKSTTESSSSSSSSSSASRSATTSSAAPTSTQAGANETIADYIKDNGITETPVRRGDPGTPTITMPPPEGWADAGPKTPTGAYDAIVFTDPSMAADPPTIVSVMSRLTGDVDPAKIFEYAPGELKNLPGYESAGEGGDAKLGGFDAYQIGATYVKDGTKKLIAQKTVVIPAADGNGIFVLQLNAQGNEDQVNPLMTATSKIDEETKITP